MGQYGTMIYKRWIFQQSMFDYWKVSSKNGEVMPMQIQHDTTKNVWGHDWLAVSRSEPEVDRAGMSWNKLPLAVIVKKTLLKHPYSYNMGVYVYSEGLAIMLEDAISKGRPS